MRRIVSLFAAVCLLAGLCGGCGDKTVSVSQTETFGTVTAEAAASDTPAEVSEDVPAQTGEGTFSMPYNSASGWAPYTCVSLENRAVMQLIYEGLFTMNSSFDPEPVLCSSYTVSDDGLLYTLTLQNAAFSNGSTLSAEDVVYSMEQAEASTLFASRFDDIAAYYASDMQTVTIEMSDPNDRLPCLLTFPIVPNFSSAEAPLGTGPFVRSSTNLLTQNSQWWRGTENLNFQMVTLYLSASAEDTRDNFEIDNVHFVYNNPNASSAATFHCDYELWNSRSTVMQYLGYNVNAGMFQDETVRAAVTHAVDRTSIAESVYHNFADSACLPAPPSSSLYDGSLAQEYSFTSVAAAQAELLASASFSTPIPAEEEAAPSEEPDTDTDTDTETPEEDTGDDTEDASEIASNSIIMLVRSGNLSRVNAAREVAQDLTDVGFTVDLQVLDSDTFYYTLNNEPTGWDLYYGELYLKPDFDLRVLLGYGGDLNFCGTYPSDELSSLMDNARENSGNAYDLYEYIMDHGVICPVLFINNAVFTTRGVFSGLNPSPDSLFYDISNIYINQQ